MTTFDLNRYASLRDDALLKWWETHPRYDLYTPVYRTLDDLLYSVYGFTFDYCDALPANWYACTIHAFRSVLILDNEPYQRVLRRACKYNPDLEQHRTQTKFHETAHVVLPEHLAYAKRLRSYQRQYPNALPNLSAAAQATRGKEIEEEAHICGQIWAVPEWQLVLRPEYDLLKQCIEGRARLHSPTLYRDVVIPLSRHFQVTPSNICQVLKRYRLIYGFGRRMNQFVLFPESVLPSWTYAVEDNPVPIPLGQDRPSLTPGLPAPYLHRRNPSTGCGGVFIH